MADLLRQARLDAAKIITSGGFGADITLTTKNGATTVTVKGLCTGSWISLDTDGNPVNSTKNHVDIPEQALIDLSYPLRNAANKVDLEGHKVSFKASNGDTLNFVVSESYPNGTLGLIICMLGKAKPLS